MLDLLPDDHAQFVDQLLVAAVASVVASKSQEPFPSRVFRAGKGFPCRGTEVRTWECGVRLVSLMHTLVIMPSGPHRIEGGSCVPGDGSGIFDPTVQNSHLPDLIALSAPAAHAHTSVTRMRMPVAPTAFAARIFCLRSLRNAVDQPTKQVPSRGARERPLRIKLRSLVVVRQVAGTARLSPVPAHSVDRLLSEPLAGTQPRRRKPLFNAPIRSFLWPNVNG